MIENINFNGYIRARNGDRVLYDGKNTTTKFSTNLMGSASIARLYSNGSGIQFGTSYINGDSAYMNTQGIFTYPQNAITAYLLNLPEEVKASLSSSTTTIPIFNSNFEIDDSVLVGYSTLTPTATAAKQGYLTELAGDIGINPNLSGLSFRWDAGTISGEYNTILIGSNVLDYKLTGWRINRGLDFNNRLINETAATGFYLGPNVKTADGDIIFTTEQEILLGDNLSLTNARRVLNLVTGAVEKLATTDHRYDFPLCPAKAPQLVYNGTLIYFSNNGALVRKDLSTLTDTNIVSSNTYYSCFIYNGYLYYRYNATTFRAISLSNWATTTSANLTVADMNIPSDIPTTQGDIGLKITNIGENFLVCYGPTTQGGSSYSGEYGGVICSDITNVAGSVIEVLPRTGVASGYMINGKQYFFSGDTIDILNYNTVLYSTGYTDGRAGVKFTCDGLFGQVISFKTYDEPQTIDSSNYFILDYSYGFGN